MTIQRATLNVSVTAQLKQIIASVRSGQYQSASEVVGEGLRQLQQRVPAPSPPSNKYCHGNNLEEKGY